MKKTVLLVTGFLVLIIGVTAYLNSEDLAAMQEYQEDALIDLALAGQEMETLNIKQIKALGEEEFSVIGRSSSRPDTEYAYMGVPLKAIIEHVGINLEDHDQVLVRSADGFIVALSPLEVQEESNVYLVYKQDGEYIKPKDQGGSGPYQLIIRNDHFSQRWAKFVIQVDVR